MVITSNKNALNRGEAKATLEHNSRGLHKLEKKNTWLFANEKGAISTVYLSPLSLYSGYMEIEDRHSYK